MRFFSAFVWAVVISLPAHADTTVSDSFENLLGTSARLTVVGIDERTARTAIDAAVAEISRLDQVLSTYREDSEINKLNRDRSAKRISADLRAVIEKCISWQAKAKSHFSCKLGRVVQMWQQAGQEQVVPARPEVRALARQIRRLEITMGSGTDEPAVMLPDPILLNVSGLAKGYIIDRAFSVLRKQAANANAVKVEIGGDGRYWSDADPWQVALSTDANGVDNPASTVSIQDGAIAASGHRDRGIKIGRRTFSHILQTRDGWPMHNAPNTVVTAPTAVAADAAATALATMSATAGSDWAERINGIEALLTLDSGQSIATVGWHGGTQPGQAAQLLTLSYEIPAFSSARYRRPYVAMWITDERRQVIRNLLLLGESERWARENSRWWRQVGRRDETILTGLARPTRRPGEYRVIWDGRDDQGNLVTAQVLTLHIEAAREHGEKDYTTLPLDLSARKATSRGASGEIGSLTLNWPNSRQISAATR